MLSYISSYIFENHLAGEEMAALARKEEQHTEDINNQKEEGFLTRILVFWK